MRKSFHEIVSKRLNDRFGIEDREARLILKEVLLVIQELLSLYDAYYIPYVGKFFHEQKVYRNRRIWNQKDKVWFIGDWFFNTLGFSPTIEIIHALKKRKKKTEGYRKPE